ncbi:MAG: hypothetical protein ACRDF0_02270, partial [Candidatus Limnocylindria bacterium]
MAYAEIERSSARGAAVPAAGATPPVETTLRILVNSVPYLLGAAVVRQGGSQQVVAEVGRMPWLHDRRLMRLQLPDHLLPPNRAVALDWPVPYQAEWVGAPPRLLIARLVARRRTVGVLLGTLIDPGALPEQSREALDLSCELIAAAVAADRSGRPRLAPVTLDPSDFDGAAGGGAVDDLVADF